MGRRRTERLAADLSPIFFDPAERVDGRQVVWTEAEQKHTYHDSSEGTKGPKGDPGSGWLTGEGAPDNSQGRNDDLYLDTDTGDVYKKGGGTWL